MSEIVYKKIWSELSASIDTFTQKPNTVSDEINEDFQTILDDFDINKWSSNIDGTLKDVSVLLTDLQDANKTGDKQKCMGSIAMLRCAIADIASCFSNATDSMQSLVIEIDKMDKGQSGTE